MAATSSKSRVLTDHDEIRQWAEERQAQPACVRGTGGDGDIGMIRLDFPGYSGKESLEPIDWDEWFQKFDEMNLALLVQDKTARGQKSNFNKLIGRETAQAREQGVKRASRRGLQAEGGRASASGRPAAGSASKGTSRKAGTRSRRSAKKASTTRSLSRSARSASRGSKRASKTQSARGRSGSHRRAA